MMIDPFDGDGYLPSNDNAWLRMDDRTNRMIVTGVLIFDDRVPYDDLVDRFDDRLTRFDRFRQRLVEPWHGMRPRWEEDPLFEVENHVTHVALPEPQGEEEFQGFVGDVMDDDLDHGRPLWQTWLVEGAGDGDGNALVVRIHHALADGFALLYVLFGLADNPDEIELPIGELPPLPGEEGANGTDDTDSRLPDASSPLERLSRGAKAAGSVLSSFPLSREPETPLRGRLTASKRVSWTRTFGLDDVKSAAHSHDGTLNDLLMAVTAGAFRRYTEERDTEVPQDLELTTAMPVNLKPLADRDEQLGNYFGLGFIDLPVGVRDIRRRVRAVQDRTGVLKQGTEARMTYSALDAVGAMPDSVQDVASTAFRGRVTAAITNVPGPLEPLEIAGTEVDDIIFWAPTTEDIGIGLSIFSYGGRVRIGVAVNENVVPEPDALADAFEEEMEEVLASTAANP